MVYMFGFLLAISLVSAQDQIFFGQGGTNDISAEAEHNEKIDTTWNCTLRGWVRAPDLAPSRVFPGEARMAANGSACGDIQGWAVGLRMKERAIVKLKNPTATSFPVKPTRKPYNATARATTSVDYNDIFRGSDRIHFDTDDDEYRTARLAYDEAIRNKKLWDVEGVERKVFDVGRELPFGSFTEGSDLDIVEAFHVNVPNTNLPPIEDRMWSSQVQGSDDQLLNAETLFEYYLNVTLSNGTILDVPAGRAGFIPHITDLPDRTWPHQVALKNPRANSSDDLDEKSPEIWSPRKSDIPACDKQSRVDFDISLTPTPSIATAGQNITLDIVLNRRGNGTEYPSVLNVNLHSSKDLDWAKRRLGSEEAYQNLLDNNSQWDITRYRRDEYVRRLATKPMKMLEKERAQREENRHGSSSSYKRHRRPLKTGQGRYDFEDLEEPELDQYRFQIELEVPYNLLPAFNTTFHSFRPRISLQLHTVFLCALDEAEPEEEGLANLSAIRDKAWIDAELESRINKRHRTNLPQRSLCHTSEIDFDLILPATSSQESSDDTVVSYSDALARAPVISLDDAPIIEYPLVNHEVRKESKAEQLRSRYNNDQARFRVYSGVKSNPGGAHRHAAKMWQAKELAADQL